MTPAVVADVGNSRIKWGRCSTSQIVEICSLPPEDPAAWHEQLKRWNLPQSGIWIVTGVHPPRRDTLAHWLREQGLDVRVVDDPRELPLHVLVERPDHVGIDRLLDAVAVNQRRTPDRYALIVDAGSAVTVDFLDSNGAFTGGTIFPGFRLMAQALHDYTALVPLVDPPRSVPPLPGTATRPAVEAGIYFAVLGGIRTLIQEYANRVGATPEVFLTGGDSPVLHLGLPDAQHWPHMTLEGIRLTAEALA
jgi:type III pantothenate kinase